MHNYTLQCFGQVAALTNEKGVHVDGYLYFFRSMGLSNFTYITLSLNTTMEQVA